MCVSPSKRFSAEEALKHPWLQLSQDGTEKIDINRPDLPEIIFTQKELETIKKEYIFRLEKLKKQRLHQAKAEHSFLRCLSDEDLLFTEHNLDTKED